jgi:putative toxin-antitoxin system antitoxin component (TIGR02293 family)
LIQMKELKKSLSNRVAEAPVSYRAGHLVRDSLRGAIPAATVIARLKGGLAFRELEELRDLLDLPMDRLAAHLGISRATLHRRKVAGRLDTGESDRIFRYARLLGLAVSTMESLGAARAWLAAPQVGLGGESPLAYAETEVGAREVEDLLGRIEYGVLA